MQRIILLRGLGRDQLHWNPLLAQLQSTSAKVLIETPDLPGAGVLYQQKSPVNIDHYIPAIERQLSGFDSPAILVGLSFGGMIALKWAEQCPEKFSRVVLINSSSRLSPFYHRLQLQHVIRFPKALLGTSQRTRENAIFQLTCNTRPVDESIIRQWVQIQEKHPVSFTNKLRQVIAASRLAPPLPSKLPPIHILNSKADRLVHPRCSQKLIDYYDASSSFHETAGHDLPQDAPNWVAEQLLKL
ncbi:alpha/beta hydrolase [Aliikangiella marina]|uniref:Alpha/beta hydrolase n=1 Tax=Aliikangiella marina TaxID=1712262 RepID=A0A545T7J2_9GAMM|nr:alpha/beta hydrolase [Aliikangiella marina]TQV73168.1 alpha/beta hydrolase [Aliikangiella marina]